MPIKRTKQIIIILVSGIFLFGTYGCQKRQRQEIQQDSSIDKQIDNLELKIKKLEELIHEKHNLSHQRNRLTPVGKIKSLTFRIGTEDDRLRIYWEDGSKSDLPCTKEQFIWACG